MKEYKYLRFVDRRNTDSDKWDNLKKEFGRDDLIATWVADMDIESPKCVQDALMEYVRFNVNGYYRVPDDYYDAIISWQRDWHSYNVRREWIRFVPGVVQGIYWTVKMMTEPGDAVAIMPPVYYPFKNSIMETGRTPVEIPLICKAGHYTVDFDAFEKAISDCDVKIFILCSPHNPVGRVWTRDELYRLLTICRKYGVLVIADEIHNDLILGEREHTTTALAGAEGEFDDMIITFVSASKTFNLAAVNQAIAIIPGKRNASVFDSFTREIHISEGTPYGYIAYRAAYRDAGPWLDELVIHLRDNYTLLREMLAETLPEAVISPLEGTYLVWVDLSTYLAGRNTREVIQDLCGIAPDYGAWFGGDKYDNFIRLNIATSRDNVAQIATGLAKLVDYKE